jgi:hypothetical protein
VYLLGVHLISVYLIGVHLISVEAGDKILRISDALVLINLFTHHAFLFSFYTTRTTAIIKPIKIYAEPRADENNN